MLVEKIKNQITQRLQSKSIAVSKLEKKAGVGAGTVLNILNNRSKNPGIEALSAIAKALDCSLYELIEEEVLVTTRSPTPNTDSDKQKEHAWFKELYIPVSEHILKYIEEKKHSVSLEQFIFLVKESYVFSLTKKNKCMDTDFIEWLIDQNIQS